MSTTTRLKIANYLDIPEGTTLPFEHPSLKRPLLLCRVDGEIYCIEDNCSHRVFPLRDGDLEGFQLRCPLHGATFDVRTGEATGFPAYRAIKTFPLHIDEDHDIFVDIETDPEPGRISIGHL